jgi:trigger factor
MSSQKATAQGGDVQDQHEGHSHDHAPLVELLGVEVEESKSWERVVSVRVPVAEWEKARGTALVGVRRKASLPGFRKGKVPKPMVEKHYGQEIAYDALDWLLPRAWHQAMHDLELDTVNSPEFSDIDFGNDDGEFCFKGTVQVRPEVSIKGWKGLKVTWYVEPAPEDGVDQTLNQLLESRAEHAVVERESADGDRLTVDFHQVEEGGLPIVGTEVTGHVFELGSTYVLEAFSEGLRGMKVGEERVFPVAYPDDYDQETLAGETRQFKATLQQVEEKKLPTMDDEFAAEMGEFKSMQELRDRIAGNIKDDIDQRNQGRLETSLVQSLLAVNEFELPPAMIDDYTEHLIADQEKRGGREMEAEERKTAGERLRPGAEFAIKRWFLLDAVGRQEDLGVNDEDFEEHLKALAEAEGGELDEIRKSVERAQAEGRIREDLLHKKVFTFLRDAAKIKEEQIPQPTEQS